IWTAVERPGPRLPVAHDRAAVREPLRARARRGGRLELLRALVEREQVEPYPWVVGPQLGGSLDVGKRLRVRRQQHQQPAVVGVREPVFGIRGDGRLEERERLLDVAVLPGLERARLERAASSAGASAGWGTGAGSASAASSSRAASRREIRHTCGSPFASRSVWSTVAPSGTGAGPGTGAPRRTRASHAPAPTSTSAAA